MDKEPRFDVVGYWSELKLEIVRKYASTYSKILSKQDSPPLTHIYVDAFAGAGMHVSRSTGETIKGSPLVALEVQPPFREYHFIELDRRKAAWLEQLTKEQPNVFVYSEDCNEVLIREVLPRCRYEDYRRAFWLLDPYGLDLHWPVIEGAGRAGTIDLFLNFPMMDMNRNVLWSDQSRVSDAQRERMTAFWGADTWRQAAYSTAGNLFGYEEKLGNLDVARAFCRHLRTDAGFKHVSEPLPMRNTHGAVVYYLVFASQKPVAAKIARDIFARYRDRTS